MGHTILAMGGKEHHDHRSLVAKAFRATALERWEPSVIGPVCDQLIDEIKNDGHADLVKALTFEFPTRIISTLLGLPPEDLDLFRRLSLDLISIPTDIMAGLNAATELHGYFLDQVEQRRRKLDQRHHRRPRCRRNRRRKAHRRGHHRFLTPAVARRIGDHLPLVGQPALPVADPPRAVGDDLSGPVTDSRRDRRGTAGRKHR